MIKTTKKISSKPFLKWAGGKTQLLLDIQDRFPFDHTQKFSYVEPFVGSGAVLFWVLDTFPLLEKVVINDVNQDLINVYEVVKTNVGGLIEILYEMQSSYYRILNDMDAKKNYFYQKRLDFNLRDSAPEEQAALFVFLNKTCFNGLYRVNSKNQFNVPIGSYKMPKICDEGVLLRASDALAKVTILNEDFYETIEYVGEDVIYYMDPPYKPISKTASFNSYSKGNFDDSEQYRLKEFCDEVSVKGGKWLLSNSDVKNDNAEDDFFDELYSEYNICRVKANRNINSKSTRRGRLNELLVSNF